MEGKGCVRLLSSPAPADTRRFFRGGSSEPVSRFSMPAGMSGEEGLAGLASRFDVADLALAGGCNAKQNALARYCKCATSTSKVPTVKARKS